MSSASGYDERGGITGNLPSYSDTEDLFSAIEAYAESMGDAYGHDRVGPDEADELLDSIANDGERSSGRRRRPSDSFSDDESERRDGGGRKVRRRKQDAASPPTARSREDDYDDDYADDDDYPSSPIIPEDPDERYRIPPLAEVAFHEKLSLPAATPMSPSALHTRLTRDLDFPEASAMFEKLNKNNSDPFSCMPTNEHLYEDVKLFSQRPEDVLEEVEERVKNAPRFYTTAVDLNQHGKMELPSVPDRVEDLPKYVGQVQTFFLSELEARERSYVKLLSNYCIALVLYIRRQAIQESRGMRVVDRAAEVRRRTLDGILSRYYTGAARLARTMFLHLYLSVCRECSRRLAATQSKNKDLFVFLKYEWKGERQMSCLFHSVMENHGVSTVDGIPITAQTVRNMNHLRVELGLLPVRFGLLEKPGEKVTEPPVFCTSEPRAAWYLTSLIVDKLTSYSKKRKLNDPGRPVAVDHPYNRNPSAPSYGSTVESMLEPPDPERELPCDPYVPPCITVAE